MQGLAVVKLSTQILSTSFLDEYHLGTKLSLRSVIHCSIEHKDQMLREVPVMSKIGISHPICVAAMHKFRLVLVLRWAVESDSSVQSASHLMSWTVCNLVDT